MGFPHFWARLCKSTVWLAVQSPERTRDAVVVIDSEHRLILTPYHLTGDGEDKITAFVLQQVNGEPMHRRDFYEDQLKKGKGGFRALACGQAAQKRPGPIATCPSS